MEAYVHCLSPEGGTLRILFSGCDYRCRYCNTPRLVEFRTEERMATRDVATAIDASGCGRVLFSGGEPLLQRAALVELLRHCRTKGLQTAVDTNASKPEVVEQLLDEGLADELLVDLKATPALFAKVTRAGTFFKPAEEFHDEFMESLALLKEYGRKGGGKTSISFRTVVTPGLLYRKEDILELAAMLDGFPGEWTLAPFRPDVTLDPALKGVEPPTTRFLETLAGFVRKTHPALRVEVEEILRPIRPIDDRINE